MRQRKSESLQSAPAAGVGSSKLRSDLINMFPLKNLTSFEQSVFQNTARAGWQSQLFLSFCCLRILPRITFLSGGIKFRHHGIKLSHCAMIFESHIHNLWIYNVCVCVCLRAFGGRRSERGQSSICSVRCDEQNRPSFIYLFLYPHMQQEMKKAVSYSSSENPPSRHSCRASRYVKRNTQCITQHMKISRP